MSRVKWQRNENAAGQSKGMRDRDDARAANGAIPWWLLFSETWTPRTFPAGRQWRGVFSPWWTPPRRQPCPPLSSPRRPFLFSVSSLSRLLFSSLVSSSPSLCRGCVLSVRRGHGCDTAAEQACRGARGMYQKTLPGSGHLLPLPVKIEKCTHNTFPPRC